MANKKHTVAEKPNKNPANQPNAVVIQKIDVRKPMRTEQDIPKWRNALRSAEAINPRRKLLYNLYADVVVDGHVESVMGKRKDAVTAANWQFVDKDGKGVDAINEIIDTIGFDDALNEIIESRFWGYTILEPKFWKGVNDTWEMSAGLLPRLHYRPELGIVTYDAVGDDGINIREGIYAKTILEAGNVDDLGLLLKASPYQILKRGGLGDYASFIQTYGNPLIDATWDGFDEAQRLKLKEALTGLGAGGNIIRPEGTTIDVKENNAKNTGDAHGSFLGFLNKEISKALLGSTETTESSTSSGYAQAKTHQDEDNNKHENDITFVRKLLNSRFIRILQAHGFDTLGGRFIVEGEETEITKAESFVIHSKLALEHNLPVDDDFWYKNYGVTKPDNYDQLKKEAEAKKEEVKPVKEKQKPSANKEEKEEEVKLSVLERLRSFFVKAPQVGAVQMSCSHHRIQLAESDGINNDALLRRIWDGKGVLTFDAELFWQTAKILNKGFKKGWDAGKEIKLSDNPSFTYGVDDPAMLTAFEQNLFKFAGGKTLAEIQELNQLFRQANSFEEFYQLVKDKANAYNGAWLETEYNTAVLTGEAAANYARLKRQMHIFPYWKYTTVGDALVRPAHAKINNLVLHAEDKRWQKLFPPNGWNCRCYVVPRMAHEIDKSKLAENKNKSDAYLSSEQGKLESQTGWGVNRADSGEVFTNNQQYIRNTKGNSRKLLDKLKPQHYGLESYSKTAKKAEFIMPEFGGSKKEFYDTLTEVNGKKVVEDYNGRPLAITAKNYNRHTTDKNKKRAHRIGMLAAMQDALLQPDEVWMNGKDLGQIVYIKYYKGNTIISLGEIYNGNIALKTWYRLAEKRKQIDKIRRGLLVYKK